MDPQATLALAQRMITSGRWNEAIEVLDYYHDWRARGGFEPYAGADKDAETMTAQARTADRWLPIPGTRDYERSDQIAIYKRTDRGFAVYWTFPKTLPKSQRRMINAMTVGALPTDRR